MIRFFPSLLNAMLPLSLLGCSLILPVLSQDDASTLSAHLRALHSGDKAQKLQAEAALIALPAEHSSVMLQALRAEWRLEAARSLALILDRRGYKFGSVDDVPPVLKKEIYTTLDALMRLPREQLRESLDRLRDLGNVYAPFLLVALNDRQTNRENRLRIACALGRFRHEAALPVLIDALSEDEPSLIARNEILQFKATACGSLQTYGLKHPSPAVRRRSAELLGWMGPVVAAQSSTEALLKLLEDKDSSVVIAALIAIANGKDSAAVATLLAFASRPGLSDLNTIHATAIALSGVTQNSDLHKISFLVSSGARRQQKEIGLIVLGRWAHAVSPQESKQVVSLLLASTNDATSILQRRAIQALGAWVNRGQPEAIQAVAQNGSKLLNGRLEVRYPGALVLGEYAAKVQTLPERLRTQAEAILKVRPLEDAANSCELALLCFTEPRSASMEGLGSLSPDTSNTQTNSSDDKPTSEQKSGSGADKNRTADNKNDTSGQQEVGFKWKEENKPQMEYKQPGQDASASETPITQVTRKEGDPSSIPAKPDAPNAGDSTGTETGSDAERSTDSEGKKKSKDPIDSSSTHGGLHKKRSKVPCDHPGLKRFELIEMDNPFAPGNTVFAGYTRVN